MDKTLVKGVELLHHLVRAAAPCSVGELARATGLNPSNVHRTLQTWMHLGFVAQRADTGEYHCTTRLFEWGCRVADSFDVRRVAHEHLVLLARSTQETIHLSVLEAAEVVYLDKIDSPQPVRAYSEIGGRAPAHCVATGKVLLAFGTADDLVRLPDPLPMLTNRTVRSITALQRELAQVRQRGYGTNLEGWRHGVNGLGAPVFDAQDRVIAAVGLSAPASRLGESNLHDVAMQLVATARQVSQALGGGRQRATDQANAGSKLKPQPRRQPQSQRPQPAAVNGLSPRTTRSTP